ncbi:uncharacterized protein LOC124367198 isoform X1 [Homalodisca vitripennis]|uniref:uncharacterized protein LOC124367198 isoform X1 n=2 Tax=Homalodisca vitripennis TaxID=197043 RepID=UPI001EEC096B|nr:uncharacterized protein LOC124367198 isoform X1 [Homalodisca vitripennis]
MDSDVVDLTSSEENTNKLRQLLSTPPTPLLKRKQQQQQQEEEQQHQQQPQQSTSSLDMSLDRPEWLDDRFLSTCLQNGAAHKSFVVNKVDITSVVPPGSNFGGCLWRVHVEYQENGIENTQSLSLVVKKPTEIESMKEAYGQFTMVEPTFYKSFMPQAYKISPNINFAPKTYVSTVPDVIILEDLKACGYLMADRCRMLDFDHCRLYVVATASFHAVSVAIHKIQPNLVESLGVEKTFSNDPGPAALIKRYNLVGMRVLADKMELLDEYKRYSNILRNSASGVWDLAVEALKPSASLNTLHQGDPWTPNMMFKYDSSGKVIDAKLFGLPAVEIFFSC